MERSISGSTVKHDLLWNYLIINTNILDRAQHRFSYSIKQAIVLEELNYQDKDDKFERSSNNKWEK